MLNGPKKHTHDKLTQCVPQVNSTDKLIYMIFFIHFYHSIQLISNYACLSVNYYLAIVFTSTFFFSFLFMSATDISVHCTATKYLEKKRVENRRPSIEQNKTCIINKLHIRSSLNPAIRCICLAFWLVRDRMQFYNIRYCQPRNISK